MPEFYIFIASLLVALAIVWHRNWIVAKVKKMAFQKKVGEKLEEFKKEGAASKEKRFRESLTLEQKIKKWDIVKYKELMRKAEMAIAQKKWKLSKPLLIQSMAEARDEFHASLKLAIVYIETGEFRKAEHLLTRLAELAPDNPVIFVKLGKIHLQKKRYKEAISAFVRALELDSKNDDVLVRLGKLYQLLMRPGLAAECFRRAAELKPREVEYLFSLAGACYADEDFDNALFTYEKILMIEPYNEQAKTAMDDAKSKKHELEIAFSQVNQQSPITLTS